jgi:hypothetical protein
MKHANINKAVLQNLIIISDSPEIGLRNFVAIGVPVFRFFGSLVLMCRPHHFATGSV